MYDYYLGGSHNFAADLPAFPPFDPTVLADLLGAPVAMLSKPPGLIHYATDESHSIGHAPQVPMAITIEHRYDSADHLAPGPAVMANVRTRLRQARGEPVASGVRGNTWEAVVHYQWGSAARHELPWLMRSQGGTGHPPPEIAHRLDLGQPPEGWEPRSVSVDGAVVYWGFFTDHDLATSEEIIGTGGAIFDTLVAVVGPRRLLAAIELHLHHPR